MYIYVYSIYRYIYARAPHPYARGSHLACSSPPPCVPTPVPCSWPSTACSTSPRATPSASRRISGCGCGCSPRSTSRHVKTDELSPTSSGQPSGRVADGTTSYANQRLGSAGTVLYRIVWSGFAADLWYYEPAKNLGAEPSSSSRPSGRQRWRRLRPRPRSKEEADLLELEAADAVAWSQGMGIGV